MNQKKFTRSVGYGIKGMWPIFKTKMLIHQSKAFLDEKTLFFKITLHLDSQVSEILVRGTNSTFYTGS